MRHDSKALCQQKAQWDCKVEGVPADIAGWSWKPVASWQVMAVAIIQFPGAAAPQVQTIMGQKVDTARNRLVLDKAAIKVSWPALVQRKVDRRAIPHTAR